MNLSYRRNVITLIMVCMPMYVLANTLSSDGTSMDEASMDEMIVTATRNARTLNEIPVSASVLNATDIADTPTQSLDDVLRHVAGVNLPIQTGTQAHPTADNISMRGLGGIHALVLLDGVPVNDPFFGYVQWGRIPLETIDRVEVVRGGGSPLWGNFAMGGVINIITRTPENDEAIASVGAGGFGTYRSSVYGSYGITTSQRINVAGEVNGTDGFMAVPDYARRAFDTPTSFAARNFEVRDRWQAANNLLVDMRYNYHTNNQQLGTLLSTNHQDMSSYQIGVTRSFGEHASLAATAFHSQCTFVTSNPIVTDLSLPLSEQTEHSDNIHTTPFHNTGGSLTWSQDFQSFIRNFIIGVDANDVTGSDSANILDQTGTNMIRTDVGRGEQLFMGGFAQVSIVPMPKLEVLASGRVQYFAVRNGFDGNPGGIGNEPNQSVTKFDPRLSARYSLNKWFALRGAYYQAFRAPTLDNLYRGFASNGGIYYPNSNLKPETLEGGEVGIDFTTENVRTQLTYYHTHINNLITTASLDNSQLPAGFFYGGRLVNASSALAKGIEAEINWKITHNLSTSLNYTWAESLYTANPRDIASIGQQLTDVPRSLVSVALSYQDDSGWRIAADTRYISATSWTNADHTDPGFPYQASADPHYVIDLSAMIPVKDHIELNMQVQNLLDRRYIVNPGPYNPPQYGTPFEAYIGIRIHME